MGHVVRKVSRKLTNNITDEKQPMPVIAKLTSGNEVVLLVVVGTTVPGGGALIVVVSVDGDEGNGDLLGWELDGRYICCITF